MSERSGGKPEGRVRPVSLYGDLARGAIWGGGGDSKDGIVGVLVALAGLCDVNPELLERADRQVDLGAAFDGHRNADL